MTPIPRTSFWAKLSVDGSNWHPLVAHSADIAAVMERLLQPDSVLVSRLTRAAGLEEWPEPLGRLLVLLASLHDLGKANHGFQERRYPNPRLRRVPHEGHVSVVFQSLGDRAFTAVLETAFSWAPATEAGALLDLLGCAIAHHGRPYDIEGLVSTGRPVKHLWAEDPENGRAPLEEVRRLIALGSGWTGLSSDSAPRKLPSTAGFTHLVAGMINLADWIGSTERFFPLAPWADSEPASYMDKARRRADHACRTIGVVASRRVIPCADGQVYPRLFPAVFGPGTGNRPTPLQEAVIHGPLPSPGTRVVIESETGSGKTEAALALYARLREAARVGGLMFALPTRASAGAMHDRVRNAVNKLYPDDPPHVVLAAGGLAPRSSPSEVLGGEQTPMYPDARDEEMASWASSRAKRFLAGEVVVGTVDQVLLAALAVRHANLRLAALSRHLLVVDEVHSYDRYMLEALRTLMDFHSQSGGVTLLMSATLAASARTLLGGGSEVPILAEATGRPYPVVSHLRPAGDWVDEAIASRTAQKEVSWELAVEEEALEAGVRAARAGARVCVLRNTIKAARATNARLQKLAGSRLLWAPPGTTDRPTYHARYAPPDRDVLDRSILRTFGRGGGSGDGDSLAGGVILVSTQVVEQSLDVDFDFLVTDLCPVDVLLQRIGRLHRHPNRDGLRPADYRDARVAVIAPAEGFGPDAPRRGPHGWGTVYENLPALELTRRLVQARPMIRIPADNRALIEQVYHPERDQVLEQEGWTAALDENLGRTWARVSLAADAVLDFSRSYSENTDRYQKEKHVRTRIGDDTVRVFLDPPVFCWYAEDEKVDHVDLRVDQLPRDLELRDPQLRGGIRSDDGSTIYPFGAGSLKYGLQGWIVSS